MLGALVKKKEIKENEHWVMMERMKYKIEIVALEECDKRRPPLI